VTAIALPSARFGHDDEVYRRRFLIAFVVTLASVLELVDTSIVNVAIPHMMGTLGATLDEIAWVSTGYIVANVIILPLTSWLSDRFGRRNFYTGSVVLFTVASFFCGHATTLGGLITWRIVQGLGGGALISTAQAILFDVFPIEERGISQAIFGMGVMVGPTLGPTLGGWLTENFSWPMIFYINIPLGMLAALGTWNMVPEPRHRVARADHVDWTGLALLIIAIGSLQIMLERGERHDWFDSKEVVVEAWLAVSGGVLFIWHELRTDHPVVNLRILGNRQLGAGVAFGAVLGFALYASVFALPVYLQSLLGFSAWDTGKVILPGALASAATMAFSARLAQRIDVRPMITFGGALFLLAMWQCAHFTTQTGTNDLLMPMILRGVGLGLIFVPLTNAAVADLHPRDIPQGTGLFNLSRQLGGSAGIAIVATLITHFTEQGRTSLVAHITTSDPATRAWLDMVTRRMQQLGGTLAEAQLKAEKVLDRVVTGQAAMLAYEKIFLMMGLILMASCLMLFALRTGRIARGAGAGH
jgi:DHA2 family multidrug resistance protein